MTDRPAMTDKPDRRTHAWREDLAAEILCGIVDAPRYVEGVRKQLRVSVAALRREPRVDAGLDTEALFGEIVTEYDVKDGWSWVQLARDRYVGYMRTEDMSADVEASTHKVKALGTFIYPEPDIKAPPLMHISLNTPLTVAETGDKFFKLAGGGHVIARHVTEIGRHARDYVDIAERFIGTSYLWGGRTRIGLDCSGLVQIAMEAAGLICPRDTDMQREAIGSPVSVSRELEGLVRGDLVFWNGHVGIMTDGVMLLHANAHQMAVAIEPLMDARDRAAKAGAGIIAIRRPIGLCA